MPWIQTVPPEEAAGRLAEAYQWQSRKLGRPTEFTQLGSLDAEVVHARLVLYRASENVPSQLTPRQRTLISYLTSILNVTPHCASLARPQILGGYWRYLGAQVVARFEVETARRRQRHGA